MITFKDQIHFKREMIALLEGEIKTLEKLNRDTCEHKRRERWSDPSGNNDSGTECLDCGKWL